MIFVMQVREQILQRYRIARHQKTYVDIIREEAVPNIGFVLYCHQLPVCRQVICVL